MRILFDNVNMGSSSGPNSFARKLKSPLEKRGHHVDSSFSPKTTPDVQLAFIVSHYKYAPIVQRLDGLYFNIDQDYQSLNGPILSTYQESDAVIYQSEFNRNLAEYWFGEHENGSVIRNGADVDLIKTISPMKSSALDKFENIWCCAASWRPHKRLSDNVRYFLEHASDKDCLVIAGENPDFSISNPRILYAGQLDWASLISLYKRSSHFLHLAWLDHCPNVVVDARVSGCHIICSSTGGTSEIAGENSTIIKEEEWDFSPIKLYSPPRIDFANKISNSIISEVSIEKVAEQYIEVMESVL